jgi:hypothetical protein
MICSFKDIIDLWDDRHAMAVDIGATFEIVRKWRERDHIPATWWTTIVAQKPARDAGVSINLLALFAARRAQDRNAGRGRP